jgi:hypothetical protein
MGWTITFGIGGYDPTKPDDNIVSREWSDEPTDEVDESTDEPESEVTNGN